MQSRTSDCLGLLLSPEMLEVVYLVVYSTIVFFTSVACKAHLSISPAAHYHEFMTFDIHSWVWHVSFQL